MNTESVNQADSMPTAHAPIPLCHACGTPGRRMLHFANPKDRRTELATAQSTYCPSCGLFLDSIVATPHGTRLVSASGGAAQAA